MSAKPNSKVPKASTKGATCASATYLAILIMTFGGVPVIAAEPLRATIEQFDVAKGWIPSERLPLNDWEKQVAPRLKSGLAWSDKLLPGQGNEAQWVPIPPWLAGHWHIEKARFVLDKTGLEAPETLNLEDDIFGYQQDKNGGYWELVRNPVTNMTEGDKYYSRFVHYDQKASMRSASQFVLESNNLEVNVSKKNGRIKTVRKRHDVYAWTLTGNVVEANDQVQFLDNVMQVKDNGSGTVKTRPAKIAPYQRVDVTGDGFNARESFKQFLEKHGMAGLIPSD